MQKYSMARASFACQIIGRCLQFSGQLSNIWMRSWSVLFPWAAFLIFFTCTLVRCLCDFMDSDFTLLLLSDSARGISHWYLDTLNILGIFCRCWVCPQTWTPQEQLPSISSVFDHSPTMQQRSKGSIHNLGCLMKMLICLRAFTPSSIGPCAPTIWKINFHFLLFQMPLITLTPNCLMVTVAIRIWCSSHWHITASTYICI